MKEQQTTTEPAFRSVNAALVWAGIGRTKAYELIRDGQWRAFKMGARKTLIETASLKEWAASLRPIQAT